MEGIITLSLDTLKPSGALNQALRGEMHKIYAEIFSLQIGLNVLYCVNLVKESVA